MSRVSTETKRAQRIYLQTFGCQMNERDSEAAKGLLLNRGYELTENMDSAGVVLFNTCSVRQHAEERILGRAGILSKLKRRYPETLIGILGCMAQEHGAKFFRRMPVLDLICGPGNLIELPDILDRVRTKGGKVTAINRINDIDYALDGIHYRSHRVKASVNIMSGCDHRCTYCIVPMTRGIERSRPSEDIIREIQTLTARGFKEVLLLGQNVNCYGKKLSESIDFVGLLKRIDRETEIGRVRFITSHPKDASDALFSAMHELRSVCAHLHLPVQSGSSRVLKRMKREHTREWFLDRIESFRRLVPNGALSTDIIVGFPGETENDFEMTQSLLEQVQCDFAYIFKYSPRPGTPALKLTDDVPESVKHIRLQQLMRLQQSIGFEKSAKMLGKVVDVLFEDRLKKDPRKIFGRSETYKRVVVTSDKPLEGEVHPVEVTQVLNDTLIGKLASLKRK